MIFYKSKIHKRDKTPRKSKFNSKTYYPKKNHKQKLIVNLKRLKKKYQKWRKHSGLHNQNRPMIFR